LLKQLLAMNLTFRHFFKPVLFLLLTQSTMAQDTTLTNNRLFDARQLELISKDFKFTEGPAADQQGNIFFTDQPNNQIWKYGIDRKLSVFLSPAGRANGTYFDREGNLIVCADEHQQLWSIRPDKKVSVLFKDIEGKHLNGPNDLWVDQKGGIYITDPYYQRDYWERKAPELDGEKIYYLPKGKNDLVMVSDALKKPNGIVGSPDGKTLYVADIGDNKIYRFSVMPDGRLSSPAVFVNQGADGITLDAEGNLYLAGKGVTVFDKTGKQIAYLKINEPWTANLCFGGKNRDELFITASTAVYRLPMNVKGAN
jgi:gluconolactonase